MSIHRKSVVGVHGKSILAGFFNLYYYSLLGYNWKNHQVIQEVIEMSIKERFTGDEAKSIGEELGIDWSRFDVEQFRMGLGVELEHGLVDPHTNVTDDDPIMTGKIALAHLNEFADYYTRLYDMEEEAEKGL